jgi:hypothetical protein
MKIYKYIILLSCLLIFAQPASASTPGNAVFLMVQAIMPQLRIHQS